MMSQDTFFNFFMCVIGLLIIWIIIGLPISVANQKQTSCIAGYVFVLNQDGHTQLIDDHGVGVRCDK